MISQHPHYDQMVTCPWCGTSFTAFLSNCKNCGGPIPAPAQAEITTEEDYAAHFPSIPPPPPAPRPFSDSFIWRLLRTDAWAISSLVFIILGGVFSVVGAALTLGVITAFIGIPFGLIGMALLGASGGIAWWRYQEKMKIVNVLRWGETAPGRILDVYMNPSVQINGRSPWNISYEFQAGGQTLSGQVTTLTPPAYRLQPGSPVYVLFMPANPGQNALYPHP